MLIDWFTVIAQIINFLILVWLLKRFLYRPILLAIDTREKAIAVQIAEAAAKQDEAEKERADFQNRNTEFDRQRESLLTKAMEEASARRQHLLEEAREEFESLRSRQNEALNRERQSVGEQIVKRSCQEVFAIARKTLSDLASASLEASMAEVFVQRLRALNAEDKEHLTSALKAPPGKALVRSTFELPPPQQTLIENAVKDTLSEGSEIEFVTAPDLVSGIELTTQGFKVSWSISEYLASLEKCAEDTVKEKYVE